MNLRAFLDELVKIADAGPPSPSKPVPINATAPKGPSVPTNGLKKPPPLPAAANGGGMFGALMEGMKGKPNPLAKMKLAMKLAAIGARTMLPKATAASTAAGWNAGRDIPRLMPMKNVPNEAAVAARFRPGSIAPPPTPASGTFSAPPRSVVTPPSGPVASANTIPAPAAASSAPTQRPAAPAPASSGMRPAPPTAAPDPNAAATVPPPARMPKFAESNPPHGEPGHNHASAVEKLRAAVKEKHPHLVEKKASVAEFIGKQLGPKSAIGKHMVNNAHAYDLGGLGILALPAAHNLGHQAMMAHEGKEVDKTEAAHAGLELAGLGTLAAPTALKVLHGGH